MNLTNSQEEYLKSIYILSNSQGEIKVTEIANKMKKTKASVNSAIKNLKTEGFLVYEPYGKIELTEKGIIEAKRIIEAYDIVKLFLKEIIGVNEDNLENESKKMKTILSSDTLNKIAKYTNVTLGLYNLECGYDISNDRCVKCERRLNKN